MVRQNEQGFVLPLVMIICTMITFSCYLLLAQSIRFRQASLLHIERIQATYAAESGVNRMQAALASNHRFRNMESQQQHLRVSVQVESTTTAMFIRSIARGRWHVKQSVRAEIDPTTFAFRRWIE